MKNFTFSDFCALTRPDEAIIKSWDDTVVPKGYKRGLAIKLEASHAGMLNDNRRLYLPSAMKKGTKSFLYRKSSNKPRKLLKHHDAMADPVGIITGAEFVWTIPDELQKDPNVLALCDNSTSIEDKVVAAKRFMQTGIPFQKGWKGLGYISLDAVVLDEKTIEQVRSGLLDSVSTSFDANDGGVYCSECGQNLREDMCDHRPGKVYKDEETKKKAPCAWIPEVHDYKECSFVNFDADPLTTVEVVGDAVEENQNFIFDKETINKNSSVMFSFKDYKEDEPMAKPKTKLSDIEQKILDIVKELRPDLEDEAVQNLVKDLAVLEKDGKYHPEQDEADIDDKTALQYAIENIETKDQEIDAEAVYADMEADLEEDAKLSTEKRKSLSKSTFCGPNRSFPVPDCAHVTAARRLIGRYKGPGDKTSILACVNRKAKALGCGSKGDAVESQDSAEPEKMELPSCDMLATLEDKEAKSLYDMAEAELINRKLTLTRPCAKCAEAEDRAKTAEDTKTEIEAQLKDMELQLKYLRAELRNQANDYTELMSQNIDIQTKVLNEKLEKVSVLAVLRGKFASVSDAQEGLGSLNLDEQEAVLMEGFDITEASKKLNDGMDHVPSGEKVTSPGIEDNKQSQELFDGLDAQQLAVINKVKEFIKDGLVERAKDYYGKMVARRIIDSELLPFDVLSADDQSDTPAE